jgi:tellurite resistance-related uncharacterized protein
VGHRVRITIFALNTRMFRPEYKPQPYAPWVQDLDTGIVYAQAWHSVDAMSDDVTRLPMAPRKDLQVAEDVAGAVQDP